MIFQLWNDLDTF